MKITLTAILLTLYLLTTNALIAQVNDMKKNSQKQNNNSSNHNNSTSDNIGSSGNDACVDGCATACADFFFSAAFEMLSQVQKGMLDNKADDPTVTSFDVMADVAYSPTDDYLEILPRVRGTWGLFSTDFRYNHMVEFAPKGTESIQTYNWEIIELNLAAIESFNARVGVGIFGESYKYTDSTSMESKRFNGTYGEVYGALTFRFDDFKYVVNTEVRYASDTEQNTGETLEKLFEFNLNLNYKLAETPHMFVYAKIGGMYQKFYGAVELYSITGGININLH